MANRALTEPREGGGPASDEVRGRAAGEFIELYGAEARLDAFLDVDYPPRPWPPSQMGPKPTTIQEFLGILRYDIRMSFGDEVRVDMYG
jgi:hypothetical protein